MGSAGGRAVPKVLFTLGTENELDRDAIQRLIASPSRPLEPGQPPAATLPGGDLVHPQPLDEPLGRKDVTNGRACSSRD